MKVNALTLSYVLFGAAMVSFGLWAAGVIDETLMLTILPMLGFSGVAALRSFVDAEGWKTYVTSASSALGGLLYLAGFFDQAGLLNWLAAWGVFTAASFAHAVQKYVVKVEAKMLALKAD